MSTSPANFIGVLAPPQEAASGLSAFLPRNRARWERVISLIAVAGDLAMILAGFLLAFWLRYRVLSQPDGYASLPLSAYWWLILFGTAAVFLGLLSKGSYEYGLLRSPRKAFGRFVVILTVCLFTFMGITLSVQTNPPVSRGFVLLAWGFIFATVYSWRFVLSRILQHPSLTLRMRKRLLVIGAGPETLQIKKALNEHSEEQFVGWVQANKQDRSGELKDFCLGGMHQLEKILKQYAVDVAVLAESDVLQREAVMYVARVCERENVEFKMVTHYFEILLSGLRNSVVAGVPVMGVDALPLNSYENRILKRTVDLIGGAVGLLLAMPIMAVFGAIVYFESPGPIIFRQVRTGRHGKPFYIFKIRSMRMDAEVAGKAQWATENDPRRLRIGAFMRKWNIDEVPQFYNVLRGDMSLVGPRPERPELIDRFKYRIPHYQTRHSCRPGVSGWAQVNGWRGNTSLEKRISYDIWYVENWNVLLDFRIMFMTFLKQQNAY